MLTKNYRLTSKQVKEVLKKGKLITGEAAAVKVLPPSGEPAGPSRFAFLISGKEIKLATERNRLRRRMRAVLWSNRRAIQGHYQAVFILRRGLLTLSFADLAREILHLLKKAQIMS
jgi:ribonuclease P protein component